MTFIRAKRPTVLIADDHQVVAESISANLREHYLVVGCVTRLSQLIGAIRDAKPDVAVVDISFDGASSLPLLKQLANDPVTRTRFVVLTGLDGGSFSRAAFDSGATGFLAKGSGTSELVMAIEAALEGRRYSNGAIIPAPAANDGRHRLVGGIRVSVRQAVVLCALLDHGNRPRAARAVGLSIRGVDYHLDQLRSRLSITSLNLLIRWASDNEGQLRAVCCEGDMHLKVAKAR